MKSPLRLTSALVLPFLWVMAASAFESPAIFRASEILSPHLLVGPNHRVRELAESDGYLILFVIDSDYGTYECEGVSELRRRVVEINAISSLVAVSKDDLFAEGMRKSVETPINAVKNVVADPGGTVRQLPHSVGHFFGKVGSGIGNGLRKIGEKESGSSSPNPEEMGRGIGKILKNAAGFDKAKLACAKQLGVDPYTDNARLQEEMEKVTWAFFAGGLPLRIGVSVASAGASNAITATQFVGLPQDLYELTASELDFQDRSALKSMGISPESIDALFANPNVIRSVRHQMVDALRECAGAGRGVVVGQISQISSVWQAYFLNDALHILRLRHRSVGFQSLAVNGRLPVGITRDGVVEVPAPVDYVIWTPEIAEFVSREDIAAAKRRLILQGNLSSETNAQLTAAGWEIIKLPG